MTPPENTYEEPLGKYLHAEFQSSVDLKLLEWQGCSQFGVNECAVLGSDRPVWDSVLILDCSLPDRRLL